MTAGLRFFYRHIYVTGLENIPAKGPAIIIANHHASLMDAALLGILLKRKAYFFARGDVFVNRPIRKILWWLHMMPVHGHQGGRNTLSANDNSFSSGQQILLKGGIIVFFPESTSHIERQLLPFRKGVFRLAFDTASAGHFSFDIPIIPIGINYDHPVACRTTVQVHAGQSISLIGYKNEYAANSAAALLHICKDAYSAVYKVALHIADKNRLAAAEQYLIFNRNNHPEKNTAWKIASTTKLEREQTVCTVINTAAEYEFIKMEEQARSYCNALAAANVTDKAVCSKLPLPIWKKVLLWTGFPLYLAGLLLNALPVWLARLLVDKKVYRQDFYSWIFVACYAIMYFIWLLVLLAIFFALGSNYILILPVVTIATGLFAYKYKDWIQESRQQKKWQALSSATKKELAAIRAAIA